MDEIKKPDKAERFITYVLERCEKDKGFAARLRRADNPSTGYQSYDALVRFGVDIENDFERLPFALVGAALARGQAKCDGLASLGKALKSCFENDEQSDLRLRRLLACESQAELCRVLRPVLTLVADKATAPLCYSQLLKDILYFGRDSQRTKLRWAQEFYSSSKQEAAQESEA